MSTPGAPPAPGLVDLAALAHVVSCNAWAALIWLLYDLSTTFADEVELIWKSPNTLPKYLYFISRYFGICIQAFDAYWGFRLYCRQATIFSGVAYLTLVLSVEASLALRVYALYGRSRSVFYILSLSLTGELIGVFALDAFSWKAILPNITTYPPEWPLRGCYWAAIPVYYKAAWAPVLFFETVLLGLMLYRCLSYQPLKEIPIMARIARDGGTYYAIVFGEYPYSAHATPQLIPPVCVRVYAVTIMVTTFSAYVSTPCLSDIASVWVSAIFSYTGSHLLLSVRAFAARRRELQQLSPLHPAPSSTASGPPDFACGPLERDSPLEHLELLPWHRPCAPSLPRAGALGSAGWLKAWEP